MFFVVPHMRKIVPHMRKKVPHMRKIVPHLRKNRGVNFGILCVCVVDSYHFLKVIHIQQAISSLNLYKYFRRKA